MLKRSNAPRLGRYTAETSDGVPTTPKGKQHRNEEGGDRQQHPHCLRPRHRNPHHQQRQQPQRRNRERKFQSRRT